VIRPVLLVLGTGMVVAALVTGRTASPEGVVMSTRYQPPGVKTPAPAVSDLMLRCDNGEIATVRVAGPAIERCRVGARYPQCTKG